MRMRPKFIIAGEVVYKPSYALSIGIPIYLIAIYGKIKFGSQDERYKQCFVNSKIIIFN